MDGALFLLLLPFLSLSVLVLFGVCPFIEEVGEERRPGVTSSGDAGQVINVSKDLTLIQRL